MKYNNSPGYELLKGYSNAVEKGHISPLVGFDMYLAKAKEIETELVGLKTVNGIEIKGYVTHFIDRVIGQVAESHPNKRKGVTVQDVKEALLHGKADEIKLNKGKPSQIIYNVTCKVAINPETGYLIQTSPGGRK